MITLSKEQQRVYNKIMSWFHKVSMDRHTNNDREYFLRVGGYAGTGKTTLISKLVSEFTPDICYVMSYTGKAVNVLRKKGIEHAMTIHSTIYTPEENDDGSVYFCQRNVDDLEEVQLFIIDEASMIPYSLHKDIMDFGIPTLYVGDHGQLEPVQQEENPFNLMSNPDYTLEEVHRHALDNPILKLATDVREGKTVRLSDPTLHNVTSMGNFSDAIKNLTQYDQIICARNETRVLLNNLCRDQLWSNVPAYLRAAPRKGDKVMCYRNNKEYLIYNGQSFIVDKIVCCSPLCPSMRFDIIGEDGRLIRDVLIPKKSFGLASPTSATRKRYLVPFDYGYAITCHKAQGSEYENVLVVHEPGMHLKHGKNPTRWLYTAITRAREKLTMTQR